MTKSMLLHDVLQVCDQRFQITPDNLRVRHQQLRARLQMLPVLVLVQMLLQPLLVWMLWDPAQQYLMLSWLFLMWGVHLFELKCWQRFSVLQLDLLFCIRCHHMLCATALLVGLAWGSAAWLFFPADIDGQLLLICVVLGLSAGAIATNPVHLPSLYIYSLAMLLPLLVRQLMALDASYLQEMLVYLRSGNGRVVLIAMLLILIGLLLVIGRKVYLALEQSLQQRFVNMDLIDNLSEKNRQAELTYKQLQSINAVLHQHDHQLQQMLSTQTWQLQQRNIELMRLKESIVFGLAALAEIRDNETGNHVARTQRYMRALAIQLKDHPRFANFLNDDNIELLYQLAPLHDIGKIGIPDHILRKPGRLTQEEFEVMKQHPLLGANALGAGEKQRVMDNPFLSIAHQIVIAHHEKWDGSGYPYGLSGDNIPIPARLMALADVYDALACDRIYKCAWSHGQVVEFISEQRSQHFDPDVVDAFMRIQQEFAAIAMALRDGPQLTQ